MIVLTARSWGLGGETAKPVKGRGQHICLSSTQRPGSGQAGPKMALLSGGLYSSVEIGCVRRGR